MAKSSIEKALEKQRKEMIKNTKKKIDAEKKRADKERRERQCQARIEARRERAASVVSGQPTVAGMKILDVTSEELVSLIVTGYRDGNYRITSSSISLPTYLEKDLPLEFEKLKQYGLISSYAYHMQNCWELTVLPAMLTYFERKECALMQENKSYNNNFYGNVTGIQIQQGAVNSTQTQTITQDFDYDSVSEVVKNIKRYDAMFDSEFGDKATELRNKLDSIEELVRNKNNPGKIKELLLDVKNLALGTMGSLIASGIVELIKMV